jgi:phospholipid-transporting ATPase
MERYDTLIQQGERVIELPVPQPNPFITNEISTCKYNALTFIPKNLWQQFHKLANVYFVCIAVLQVIPQISVSNGIPNILLPLSLVLTVSAIKDLAEDLKRRRSDKEENNRTVKRRRYGVWQQVKWKDIEVGDIIQVEKNEYFPADILLLYSSEQNGLCYVETKNLDGETNLKHKLAVNELRNLSNENSLDSVELTVKCDDANPMIYMFRGVIEYNEDTIPVGAEQMLLRASSLRNTKYIVGIVIYTGHDSKIMLNSSKSKNKFSQVESQMNRQIVYIFIMQVLICLMCATFYSIWYDLTEDDTDQYLELDDKNDNIAAQFVIIFFTWMLIFTNFVPISLIVTLETVKYLQGMFIAADIRMYDPETDSTAGVQSSNLNEELGQIQYIFSDKTGTLTCNKMEFKKFCVLGKSFGTDDRMPSGEKVSNVDFVDPSFDERNPEYRDFLLHLAACHTIVTEEKDGEVEYNSSSPDELALVCAAKFFGFVFRGRDENQNIIIDVSGEQVVLKLLNVLEFTSKRKRMSIIVQMPDSTIRLLCKGADSILLPRLIEDNNISTSWSYLEGYASEGLRTLVIAYRDISREEYEEWNKRFNDAMNDIRNRDKKVEEVSDRIERELHILGATAIEDKLQDEVPKTISYLKNAGIKVWVLTGDKLETAINIGFSCSLLTNEMSRLIIDGTSTTSVKNQLQEARFSQKSDPVSKFALVITGDALIRAMKDALVESFVRVADRCEVVIACRVSPQQKAQIVEVIREARPNCRTLAIGDGANDVNMILAAHVGVGITGLEGKQAARASDFSISQFRFLQRLLFVHGRECYRKNSNLICYNFYKNVLLVMPLFFYGVFSAFSGQILYNMWIYQLYNVFYSALPIILYALFDREMDYKVLENAPKQYSLGLKGYLFSSSTFWLWILESILQSALILFIGIFALCFYTGDEDDGHVENMWVGSVLVYAMVVLFANFRILTFTYTHFWFTWLAIFMSILMYFLVSAMLTQWLPMEEWLDNYDGRGSTWQMLKNPNSYTTILLCLVAGFLIQPFMENIRELLKLLQTKERFRNLEEEFDEFSETKSLLATEEPPVATHTSLTTRRHTGFAFSGEAGHTPQVTDAIFKRAQTSRV